MRIRILTSAIEDLEKGRKFYDEQGEDLGEDFLNSLFSDIDRLALYGGIHSVISGSEKCQRHYSRSGNTRRPANLATARLRGSKLKKSVAPATAANAGCNIKSGGGGALGCWRFHATAR